VHGYFYYIVPQLSFQEDFLTRTERRYGIKIHRYPHWCLTLMIREGGYRPQTFAADECPALGATEMETVMRDEIGVDWIVTGERAAESMHRRGMLVDCQGLSDSRKRAYPIAFWPVDAVRRYIRSNHLPMSPESTLLPRSFGDFDPVTLAVIRAYWPDDFARIKRMFPHVEATFARERFFGDRKQRRRAHPLPKVQAADDPARPAQGSAVQPAQD
jgi:3'-phosphoadenosine 5'-phosphosulfate sulfotransferase (PAPS reductase)/FAD synthetase